MTLAEYQYQIEQRDTKALIIYAERGECAYWDYMNENKIPYPQQFMKEETPIEKPKREPYPHLGYDEKRILNETYYYDRHKEINLSSF